jgi:hypothetical protein
MGPYKCFGSISGGTVGPFIAVGSIFGSNNGPIPEYQQHLPGEVVGLFVHRQVLSAATMGPYECFGSISGRTAGPFIAIGGIFCQQQWAHTSIPGASRNKQQDHSEPLVEFSAATMGPYESFGSILGGAVGPFVTIDGIFW